MAKEVNFGNNPLKSEPKNPGEGKTKSKSKAGPLASFFRNEKNRRVFGILFILIAIYMVVAFVSYFINWKNDDSLQTSLRDILSNSSIKARNNAGRMGHALSYLFVKEWFGVAAFLFPLNFFVIGVWLLLKVKIFRISRMVWMSFIILLWISVTSAFLFRTDALSLLSGYFGYWVSHWLIGVIGNPGTAIILLFILVSFLILVYNFSFASVSGIFNKREPGIVPAVIDNKADGNVLVTTPRPAMEEEEDSPEEDPLPETNGNDENVVKPVSQGSVAFTIEKGSGTHTEAEVEEEDEEDKTHYGLDTLYDPKLDLPHYKYPPIDLLSEYQDGSQGVQNEELQENKDRIVSTLNNYGIQIDKIKATVGPTVTLYEIVPAPGVRISKIKNLSDDIALSLSAIGIRIIAPLPGKGTIGIEVPNKKPEIVSMKSILADEKFVNSKMELPIGLGKTISNESFIADLTKMPHLLIAGATGQGKSVGLNAIITSLLYKKHPAELKFVLVDPKKVELTLFSKIERHFLAKLPDAEDAIITETKQVVRTLNSLIIEMEKRYTLLNYAEVRNVKEYNRKFVSRVLNPNDGHKYLPYIVVIIDEFADLIMTAGKDVEYPLTRLAQLARAVGIHLVIATQRPSINIITGTIKANFPARMAFRVISSIDSRTILDATGANQLIGRGDMLLSTGSDLLRLQCAFVDLPEVSKVTTFIGDQRAYPTAFDLPEFLGEDDESNKDFDPENRDELFEDAARIIVQHQHGSTSLLQRKLKLGYNRAGRIIDQLEAAGIVGPFEGSKARDVKFKDETSLEQYLKEIKQ